MPARHQKCEQVCVHTHPCIRAHAEFIRIGLAAPVRIWDWLCFVPSSPPLPSRPAFRSRVAGQRNVSATDGCLDGWMCICLFCCIVLCGQSQRSASLPLCSVRLYVFLFSGCLRRLLFLSHPCQLPTPPLLAASSYFLPAKRPIYRCDATPRSCPPPLHF